MKRKIQILEALYQKPVSKDEFAHIFEINNTRSVEKYISDLNLELKEKTNTKNLIELNKDEIIYDRSLKKYRFNILLPTYIPYSVLLKYLGSNIVNSVLQDDFKVIEKISIKDTECKHLIETSMLSNLVQKIIQIKLALLLNFNLKIEYKKSDNVEIKFISPHSLFESEGLYYLYASYDEENIMDVGSYRSFALSAIASIVALKQNKTTLYRNLKGNAWGAYSDDKYIIVRLKEKASNFYKREGLLNSKGLDFIQEDIDGSILIKMYYSHEQEIVNFLQKWMPFATIDKNYELKERVYEQIQKNMIQLMVQK